MEPRRKIAWPLVAILFAALVLGAIYAIYTNQPEPPRPPTAERGPEDASIVPGHRVGWVTLGLPERELETGWGRAMIRPGEDAQMYLFDQVGALVSARDGKVLTVMIKNPGFSTRGGTRVGQDVDAALREFGRSYELEGDPQAEHRLHYWDKGIHFTVEKTEITAIHVMEPVLETP